MRLTIVLIASAFLACAGAHAQDQAANRYIGISRSQAWTFFDQRASEDGYETLPISSYASRPTGIVILGAVYGDVLGISAGLLAGYIVDSDFGESWVPVTDGMALGAVLGSTIGSSAGAYIANRRDGSFLMAVGAGGLACVGAVLIAEKRPGIALLLPLVHIGLSATIIKASE